jgi:hypothetical protein
VRLTWLAWLRGCRPSGRTRGIALEHIEAASGRRWTHRHRTVNPPELLLDRPRGPDRHPTPGNRAAAALCVWSRWPRVRHRRLITPHHRITGVVQCGQNEASAVPAVRVLSKRQGSPVRAHWSALVQARRYGSDPFAAIESVMSWDVHGQRDGGARSPRVDATCRRLRLRCAATPRSSWRCSSCGPRPALGCA